MSSSDNPTAGVDHKFELIVVTDEMRNSPQKVVGYRLKDIDILFPSANSPTQMCYCGVEVPVPHGSLSNYAKQLIKEFGRDDIYVTSRTWHFYASAVPAEVVKKEREKANDGYAQSANFPDNLPEKLGYTPKKDS